MKRLVSIFTVIAMILSLGLVLSSCGEKPLGDPTKDPSVMNEVYGNTASEFFGDPVAADVLASAWRKGSVDIHFALEDAGGAPLSVKETIYCDEKAGKLVSDTLLALMGQEVGATVWVDQKGISVYSESIFGGKDAYGINLQTLTEKLEDSALAKLLEIPDDALEELIAMLEGLTADKSSAETTELDAYVASLPEKINAMTHMSTEEVKGEDGKTEYLVVTRTINNDSMKQLLDLISDVAVTIAGDSATDTYIEELNTVMTAIMEDFNGSLDFELVERVYIQKKAKRVEKSELTLDIALKEGGSATGETVSGKLDTTFSDKNITLELEAIAAGQTLTGTLTIDKKVEGDVTTYTAKAVGGTSNVTLDIINATLSHDRKSGELTLDGDVMIDEQNRIDFGATASYKVSKKELAFSMVSLTAGEESFEFGDKNVLSVTVKAEDELPAEPLNCRDIVSMSEEELVALMQKISESPLAELISAASFSGTEVKVREMELKVPEGFEVYEAADELGQTGAFINEDTNQLVLVLREDFSVLDGLEDMSIDEYGALVMKNSGRPSTKLTQENGLSFFEYNLSSNGFHYSVFVYKSEEAFWLVQYIAESNQYLAYEDTVFAVAKSVDFDE